MLTELCGLVHSVKAVLIKAPKHYSPRCRELTQFMRGIRKERGAMTAAQRAVLGSWVIVLNAASRTCWRLTVSFSQLMSPAGPARKTHARAREAENSAAHRAGCSAECLAVVLTCDEARYLPTDYFAAVLLNAYWDQYFTAAKYSSTFKSTRVDRLKRKVKTDSCQSPLNASETAQSF